MINKLKATQLCTSKWFKHCFIPINNLGWKLARVIKSMPHKADGGGGAYQVRPGSSSFPALPSGTEFFVKGPAKPTPPLWTAQSHLRMTPTPKSFTHYSLAKHPIKDKEKRAQGGSPTDEPRAQMCRQAEFHLSWFLSLVPWLFSCLLPISQSSFLFPYRLKLLKSHFLRAEHRPGIIHKEEKQMLHKWIITACCDKLPERKTAKLLADSLPNLLWLTNS